jgi:CheY-like chemotaxis protein
MDFSLPRSSKEVKSKNRRPGLKTGLESTCFTNSLVRLFHHAGSQVKILLVDDEPIVLKFAEAVLVNAGYEVFQVATGEEALKLCNELGVELALVITDVQMPGMSGRDLANCVKQIPRPIPVILMSGDGSGIRHLLKEGKLDGAPFLQKPFTPKQLLSVVVAAVPIS